MEAMRKSWADGRLDDFASHTDRRFDEVNRRFDRVDEDIHHLRTDINARFDALQRTMLQTSGGVIIALIGLIATQL
jgi:hypothetical protein